MFKAMIVASMPFVVSSVAIAQTETVFELNLESDTVINVNAGDVTRIEYISGVNAAKLTKEGAGTLEVAIVGNTNAVFYVNGGKLKFVRPGRLALLSEEAAFHVDGSDAASYTVKSTVNGTNYLQTIVDADGRSFCATNYSVAYQPWIAANALNGLDVFDFGSYRSGSVPGTGAAMAWETPILPNEVFIVWADDDSARSKVSGQYGPNPLCMLSAGYRGTNTVAGTGWNLFRTAKWTTSNLYVDDEKASSSTVPDEGWHLLRMYTSVKYTHDNWMAGDGEKREISYGAVSFGYRRSGMKGGVNSPYGGFRLAEVLVCSNYLSSAKREYVNFYLQRKWFGGYPVGRIVVAGGAALDTADAPLRVGRFQAFEGAEVVGLENLQCAFHSGASVGMQVDSGIYSAADRSVCAIPNLEFDGDATISIVDGTNAVHMIEANGVFRKKGEGMLNVAHFGERISNVVVESGEMSLNPLMSPAASLHVDAADEKAFTLQQENGTNLVMRWEDVNRNGQALFASTKKKYKYNSAKIVNAPFLVADMQNGLPMVDFGTMSDSEHQQGWGAILDMVDPMNAVDGGNNAVSDECGAVQTFFVWEDHPSVYDRPHMADPDDPDGVVKGVVGPSIYGNGGYSWRGPGGNGSGYPYRRISPGADSFKWGLKIDQRKLTLAEGGNMPIERGVHLADHDIGNGYDKPGIFCTRFDLVGGNESCNSTNGPYGALGVYGGVRIGEIIAFRHHIPERLRENISSALGVKWFGTDDYSLEYHFDCITVTERAKLSFPYADVIATNLFAEGTLVARSLEVKTLDISGGSVLEAELKMMQGGTIVLRYDGNGALASCAANSFDVGEEGGKLDLSNVDPVDLIGRSFRIVETTSATGAIARWKGRPETQDAVYAVLESQADGVYVKFKGCGMRIVVR